MRLPAILVLSFAALSACATFPELDAVAPDPAPPPRLLPLDEVLAQAQSGTQDPGPALAARAAALRARAAAIAATP